MGTSLVGKVLNLQLQPTTVGERCDRGLGEYPNRSPCLLCDESHRPIQLLAVSMVLTAKQTAVCRDLGQSEVLSESLGCAPFY